MKKNLLFTLVLSIIYGLNVMAQIDLYKAGTNKLSSVWVNDATVTDSTGGTVTPYEGTSQLVFNYNATNWFAGGQFNINNWGGDKQNYSNYSDILIASMGYSDDNNSLVFSLTDTNGVSGPYIVITSNRNAYKLDTIPLSSFKGDSTINLSAVEFLNWHVQLTSATTTGVFYVDNIQIVSIPTGINEKKESTQSITVSPNPSSGIYTIKSDQYVNSVIVYDCLGNIISNNSNLKIDLTNQPNGFYFVSIKSHDKSIIEKLIKK